jgi:hypothetical protein
VNTKTATNVSSRTPSRDGPRQIPLVVVDQHSSGSDVKTSDRQEVKQPSRQVARDDELDISDTGVHSGKRVTRGKAKLSAMKTYGGSGCVDPRILDRATGSRCVVSFLFR